MVPLFSAVFVLVIIDTSAIDVSQYLESYTSKTGVIAFLILVCMSGLFQYEIIKRVRNNVVVHLLKSPSILSVTNLIVPILLLVLLVTSVFEMIILNLYHSVLIKIIIWISYGLAITNMSSLLYNFFQWIKFNKNYLIVFFFFAILALCVNFISALISIIQEQYSEQQVITESRNRIQSSSNTYDIYNSIYDYTLAVAFIMLWVSSLLLLFHYSKKFGKVIYLFLFLLPLLYFLGRFSPLFSGYFLELSFDYPNQAMIIYTILLASGKPLGGFLFGTVFWIASKNVSNKILKEYFSLAAYGMMLLFTSNQVMALSSLDYPPFGIITISLLGLASYLIFIGIYTSSICVAQDRELRRFLIKSKEKQQDLMSQLGTAQMERSLVKTAELVINKMKAKTGVEYVDDDNYKSYLNEVIREVEKNKARDEKSS